MLKKFKWNKGECWLDISKISAIRTEIQDLWGDVHIEINGQWHHGICSYYTGVGEYSDLSYEDKRKKLDSLLEEWVEENLLPKRGFSEGCGDWVNVSGDIK